MADRLATLQQEASKLNRLRNCHASARNSPDQRYLEVVLSFRDPGTRKSYHVVQAFYRGDDAKRFALEVSLLPTLEEAMLRALQEGKPA